MNESVNKSLNECLREKGARYMKDEQKSKKGKRTDVKNKA